jgi:hypothetical protein
MSGWVVLADAAAVRAELARVENALAGRFPHRMLPDLDRMRQLVDLLGHPEQRVPVDPPDRHQRQDLDRPDDRHAAARVRAALPGATRLRIWSR